MNYISHFRLDRSDAIRIVKEISPLDVSQCCSLASISHPKAYPPPISSRNPTSEELKFIRSSVITIGEEYGFPNRTKEKDLALSRFDVAVGNYLLSNLELSPSDAGREEVWNFLTLVLLPDIAAWRFKNKKHNPEYDRWIGKSRNVFRKAWWRAYCLGADLNSTLGEDEGVNIMERPTFGLNPTLARTIAEIHRKHSGHYEIGKSDLLRLVMVQLGKLVSIINLDVLPSETVTKIVESTYLETAEKYLPSPSDGAAER